MYHNGYEPAIPSAYIKVTKNMSSFVQHNVDEYQTKQRAQSVKTSLQKSAFCSHSCAAITIMFILRGVRFICGPHLAIIGPSEARAD